MGATLVAAEALDAATLALARAEALEREVATLCAERGAELDLLTTVTGMILDLVKEIVSSQEPGPRVVRE